MAIHRLLLLTETENEGGISDAEFLLKTASPSAISSLRAFIATLGGNSLPPVKSGPRGRKVSVVGVAPEYGGTSAVGMVFDSSLQASIAIGYGSDSVGPALRKAALTGEKSVVLKGVELQYQDTIESKD
jgi:hypothetical protein